MPTENPLIRNIYGEKTWQQLPDGDRYSDLKDIVSGVPQRSIADPTVFNTFLKMIFSFTLNIIYHHLQRLIELIRTLLLESNNTINWFSENKMIVNPDKLT